MVVFFLHHCYGKTSKRSQRETPADEKTQSFMDPWKMFYFHITSSLLCAAPVMIALSLYHSFVDLLFSFFFPPFLFSHAPLTICLLFIWFPSNSTLQKRWEEHLWSKHPNFCHHSSEPHCLCFMPLSSPHLYLIYLYFKLCSTDAADNFSFV